MDSAVIPDSLKIFVSVIALVTAMGQPVMAQDVAHRPKLAVLRLKASEVTPEQRNIVNDFAANLAASLREDTSVAISDDSAVKAALDDEGLKPAGLLKVKECFSVGKALGVDYVVVGSALLERLRWHACVRVLSVQTKELIGTMEAEYPAEEMGTLYSVLASRISAAVTHPAKEYTSRPDFTWKGEYLLSFGKHRIDLEPPILLAQNADPPFEVSVVADMTFARGNHAVTNFEVFIDDRSLGSIDGQLTPPRPVKERTWTIGGRKYVFNLDLRDMRIFAVQSGDEEIKFVTSAAITVSVHSQKDTE